MRVSATEPWQGRDGRLVLEPVAAHRAAEREREGRGRLGDDARPGQDQLLRARRDGDRDAVGVPESWARDGLDVRFRRGGERFKPAGGAHHRKLKAWLREKGVVPWMRDNIPLLYRGDQLVAIADLAIDDDAGRARPDEPRWRVRWLDHPRID